MKKRYQDVTDLFFLLIIVLLIILVALILSAQWAGAAVVILIIALVWTNNYWSGKCSKRKKKHRDKSTKIIEREKFKDIHHPLSNYENLQSRSGSRTVSRIIAYPRYS